MTGDSTSVAPVYRRYLGVPLWVWLAVLLIVIVAVFWMSKTDRPGETAVYDRISNDTDCSALNGELLTAHRNATDARASSEDKRIARSYESAIDDRLRDLRCGADADQQRSDRIRANQ